MYLIWQEVYRPLEEFPQYLPDPGHSADMLEFFEMTGLLLAKYGGDLWPMEKKPAKDLGWMGEKFRARL